MASTEINSTVRARPEEDSATNMATEDLPLAVGPRMARSGAPLKTPARTSRGPDRNPDPVRGIGRCFPEDAAQVVGRRIGDLHQGVTPDA